ncbi:MAG: helix-turn-helix transcriptional regulator [Saccharopolyspora sp.]|uniref:helix-turn-helix domain-containing protein n=1 Tax=Saccharopolyspora sp. TaxID=33915 RepID=UPI0025E45260|nr:helix-turn-helix transcriptional regulator [Saccharopolyspora sp.]MBQ6643681.1 helix-turn-helix transcriptional regulator [Saccharopolyspora sp.]
MVRRNGIPVRVRRVSSELKELRLRSGLSAEEVASALGISMSKLSRMETGQRGLYADDVSALLGLYHVPWQRRAEILALVRSGADRNWWQVRDGRLPQMWQDLIRFEKDATAIHNYESLVIPGLLQTSEYAAAISEGTDDGLTPAQVDALVGARMSRQTVLHAPRDPQFEFLLEEALLRRPVGTAGLMYRQLRHLITVGGRSNVEVRVLPTSAGVHAGLEGPFVLLEFRDHPALVYLENRWSSAFLEEPEHVAGARECLRSLHDVALPEPASLEFVASIADELA